MINKDIYDMDLHSIIRIEADKSKDPDVLITRVPGGWIYTLTYVGNVQGNSSVFVEFEHEFQ